MNHLLTPGKADKRLSNSDLKSDTLLTGKSMLGTELIQKDPTTMDGLRKQNVRLKNYVKQL